MNGELSQDLTLQSLSESFSQFIVNYHINKLNTSLPELLNVLKTTESHMKKEKAQLLLIDGISMKKADKKGSKKRLNPKGGIMKRKKGKKVSEQGTYFYHDKAGHWKRNSKVSLVAVKAGTSIASKSMYEIHIVLSLSSSISNSWILDTTCGTHICKSLWGLQKIRVSKKDDFELYGASSMTLEKSPSRLKL